MRESEDINEVHPVFGSQGRHDYPTSDPKLNEPTLHPRLLKATSQLLGIPVGDLR